MPSTARAAVGGLCYHVINRGNAREEVFHKPEDYAGFCQLLQEAADRVQMREYCVIPGSIFKEDCGRREELRDKFSPLVRTNLFKDPLADQLCIGKAFGLGKLPQGFCFIRM